MKSYPPHLLAITSFLSIVTCAATMAVATPELKRQHAYFEKNVRPILAEYCIECHGEKKQKAGLRLDRKRDAMNGGDLGEPIVPGQPEKSLLIEAVTWSDPDLEMPPKKKLPVSAINILKHWVKTGAHWPEEKGPSTGALPPAKRIDEIRSTHWSYKPIQSPDVPTVKSTWPINEIDQFVLQRLNQAQLSPSPDADRRLWLRRAYMNLIGLTPTYDEVTAFLSDHSDNAYEKVVEKLLAMPEYGQRWGRHWLDVARYADTRGYAPGNKDANYPYAYTYRDYVINAFNEDKPFNRFILEQLAADHLEKQENWQDRSSLAALGFITTGPRFLNMHSTIDDRIDVVTRGLMATTVSCARCHDHKYDPIPTSDYYGLYGIFKSCNEPANESLPVIQEPDPNDAGYQKFQKTLKARQQRVERDQTIFHHQVRHELRKRAADYLSHLARTHPIHGTGNKISPITDRGPLRKKAISDWQRWIKKQPNSHPVIGIYKRLSQIPRKAAWPSHRKRILSDQAIRSKVHPPLLAKLDNAQSSRQLNSLEDVANLIGHQLETWHHEDNARRFLLAILDKDFPLRNTLLAQVDSVISAPLKLEQSHTASNPFMAVLNDASLPTGVLFQATAQYYGQRERNHINNLKGFVNKWLSESPDAPPRAMVLADNAKPYEPRVFIRGNPGRRGKPVQRGFLEVLKHVDGHKPFQIGSGRLELAQAIVHPKNPLTARVIVNRVWGWHFGKSLVRTPSDFGAQGQTPTHPLLLDYLASRFMREGWSIKSLHRWIVLSRTYRQSSVHRSEAHERDPENRLVWRFNRQKMSYELMRDTMLQVGNKLDRRLGGHSEKQDKPSAVRRTVYGYLDRHITPELLRNFDFADLNATTPKRPSTTVPQQSLYMMNSAFVQEIAESVTQKTSDNSITDQVNQDRLKRLFQSILSRMPTPQETHLINIFLKESHYAPAPSIWAYGYGRFDPENRHFTDFKPLSYFAKGQAGVWRGANKYPDKRFHYLAHQADGGHAGNHHDKTSARRWRAKVNGEIRIDGVLEHDRPQGDGIRGLIIASSQGVIGDFTAKQSKVTTQATLKVSAGDTIDFIISHRSNDNSDSYRWAPKISLLGERGLDGEQVIIRTWDAREDFGGPKTAEMNPWTALAQTLLLSNEFFFVD